MKKIFIILLLIGCVIRSSAQASFQLSPGANIKTLNNAFIILDNVHLANNGSFVQGIGDGTIRFTGNADVNISGIGVTSFDKLEIAKATNAKITLQQNVGVSGQVNFITGSLDLNNSVLNLGTTGTLIGETEASRIFSFGDGYVQVSNNLNAPVSANPGNLGAILSSTKNLGNVTIRRGHLSQTNVSGTTPGIRRYYDILPDIDNGLKATLRFQYFDIELNGLDESTLELWKQGKKNWSNVGYSSRSAIDNYVEKTGISTLSRWTLSGTMNSSLVNIRQTNAIREKPEIKNQISVWPNPVKQLVNVNVDAKESSTVVLQLYDANGSLIFLRRENLLAGKNAIIIDMSKLPAGAYNLIAENGAGFRQIIKLIKQ
jgi:type IX secretion system substrate protein